MKLQREVAIPSRAAVWGRSQEWDDDLPRKRKEMRRGCTPSSGARAPGTRRTRTLSRKDVASTCFRATWPTARWQAEARPDPTRQNTLSPASARTRSRARAITTSEKISPAESVDEVRRVGGEKCDAWLGRRQRNTPNRQRSATRGGRRRRRATAHKNGFEFSNLTGLPRRSPQRARSRSRRRGSTIKVKAAVAVAVAWRARSESGREQTVGGSIDPRTMEDSREYILTYNEIRLVLTLISIANLVQTRRRAFFHNCRM